MKRAAVSIWLTLWPLALTGLTVLVSESHPLGVPGLCSVLSRNPYLRSERETYLIGSARSDTVRVRISDMPGVVNLAERYPYQDTAPVFGQLLRVRSVHGASADRLLALIPAADSTIVLIPYGSNPACQTFPERVWLDTSPVYHLTVLLRPDSEWAAGRPTFDIPLVPPFAVYPSYLERKRDPGFDTTLTVAEYASLVNALPLATEWGKECSGGLERIAAWVRSHEPRSGLYPANEIIRVMKWNCDGIRRGR